MKLCELTTDELIAIAQNTGLRYKTGPFSICLKTDIHELIELLQLIYGEAALLAHNHVCQFHIQINRSKWLRRWLRKQAVFTIDGIRPFEPYPYSHAFPLLEWGLNWCIGTTAHNNLMLHSAVVEKQGNGLILPAMPGSGKSTLCAGLVGTGWRLLSDEFGIIRHKDGAILPIPRAAPLKNESINIVKKYAPHLCIGPRFEGTRKGTVAHFAPPPESLSMQEQPTNPKWVVFPRYTEGAETKLLPIAKSVAFTRLTNNAFNYQLTLEDGFLSMKRLIETTECFELINGDLSAAVSALEELIS